MSNANQKTLSEQLVEALGTLASKMEEFATDPETTFKLLGWDVVDVQGLEQDWGRRLVLLAKGDKVHVENLLISTKNTAWLEKVAEGWKCLVSDLSRLYAKFEQLPAQRREDQKQAIEKYLSLCREKDPKHVRLSERAKDYNEAEDKEEFLSNLNYDTDDEGVPLETPEWSVRCYFFAIENEERMRLLLKRDGGQAVHDAVSLYRMLQQSILAELGDANRLSEGASQGAAAPPVQEELGETDKVGRFTRKEAKRIGRILLAKRHYVNLPKGDPKKRLGERSRNTMKFHSRRICTESNRSKRWSDGLRNL